METAGHSQVSLTLNTYTHVLPALQSALAVGDYELALKGIAADHTSLDVGYYYFGVQRR